MKTITVFTPTYNRAHLLPRLYESLVNQTNQDFVWMVVDDGSTDGTKELVEKWQKAAKIGIEYHYKANGGMHTGHNLAYQLIETELNVCIDSDDYMPSDAVQKIIDTWQGVDNSLIAGIIGLDADKDMNVLGTYMPKGVEYGSLAELYFKYKGKGDKKIVLKTEIVKQYPEYPEYENEKLVPLGILYFLIDQKFKMIYSNDVLCVVDYQEEGSTRTIMKQYKQSPRGFAYARKIKINLSGNFFEKVKSIIHLISCGIFAREIGLIFKGNNCKFLTVVLLPIGVVFNRYVDWKIKRR